MIADYKFYHGSVFSELIDSMSQPLAVTKLFENGRLSSYTLNRRVGMQIKHSSNRLHPWMFSVTKSNLNEILALRKLFSLVFVVFVCSEDGIVTLRLEELLEIIDSSESGQAWVRVDRRKNELYSVSGGRADLRGKKAHGIQAIVHALNGDR